ncbi:hypothetical protein R3P38DRAFT_2811994 [Favolaschia claudopus]|uniref:Uncharacterized protein n=1 Tax=Favolaschia claudopus TaxID=2862362 RepID=A0AAV9Z891_9AGAR
MCEIHERGLTLSLKKIEKFKPLYNLGAAFSCGLAAGAWVALVWASLFWVHPRASHRPTPWAPAVQVCHRPLQGFRVAAAEWGNGFILTHPIAPRPGRRRFKFVTALACARPVHLHKDPRVFQTGTPLQGQKEEEMAPREEGGGGGGGEGGVESLSRNMTTRRTRADDADVPASNVKYKSTPRSLTLSVGGHTDVGF